MDIVSLAEQLVAGATPNAIVVVPADTWEDVMSALAQALDRLESGYSDPLTARAIEEGRAALTSAWILALWGVRGAKTCRTCRHWVMPECWRIMPDVGGPVPPGEATVYADSDVSDLPRVVLHTGPEFGCTLWEGVQKST